MFRDYLLDGDTSCEHACERGRVPPEFNTNLLLESGDVSC